MTAAHAPIGAISLGVLALGAAGLAIAACSGTSHAATQSTCASRYGVTGPVTDTGTATASGHVVRVEARDYAFDPTCVLGVASGVTTLVVHNTGTQLHNVSIASQGIDRDLQAGATISVRVQIGSRPVEFVCKYHRAIGMVGVLVPASAAANAGTP